MATNKKTTKAASETAQETVAPTEMPTEPVQETAEAPEVSQSLAADDASQTDEETAEAVGLIEYYAKPLGGLRLRKEPSTDSDVITVLPHGSGVWSAEDVEDGSEWIYVHTGIQEGWVRAEFLGWTPPLELK